MMRKNDGNHKFKTWMFAFFSTAVTFAAAMGMTFTSYAADEQQENESSDYEENNDNASEENDVDNNQHIVNNNEAEIENTNETADNEQSTDNSESEEAEE